MLFLLWLWLVLAIYFSRNLGGHCWTLPWYNWANLLLGPVKTQEKSYFQGALLYLLFGAHQRGHCFRACALDWSFGQRKRSHHHYFFGSGAIHDCSLRELNATSPKMPSSQQKKWVQREYVKWRERGKWWHKTQWVEKHVAKRAWRVPPPKHDGVWGRLVLDSYISYG